MKKVLILHVGMLVVFIGVAIFGYIRFWNVATVNGTPISRVDYLRALVKQDNKQTLDLMIEEALILGEGAKKGVVIDQKLIDDELATIEAQLKAENRTLDSALVASGMTMMDLEKQIRVKKIVAALADPKIEISQEEIDEFLKTNKETLPTDKSEEELQVLAKEELMAEASQEAMAVWFQELSQNAKIVYK